MSDEWRLGVPKDDPEARPAALGRGGNGCPIIVPDANFVEGDRSDEGSMDPIADEDGKDPDETSDLPP